MIKLVFVGCLMGLVYMITQTGWRGVVGLVSGVVIGTFLSAFMFYSPRSPLPHLEKFFNKK